MSTKTRATIEDLYKAEGKAELVNGEIVEMPPAGDDPHGASLNVALSLRAYEKRTGRGRAYTDGAGFHVNLPHREAFSPTRHIMSGHGQACGFLKAPRSLPWKSRARTTTARQPSGL